MRLNPSLPPVPGPCDPEDLIDGIIFAANYLGSTQLLSDKTPSKNIRMMQAQEAVSRIKVKAQVYTYSQSCSVGRCWSEVSRFTVLDLLSVCLMYSNM